MRNFFRGLSFILYMVCLCFFIRDLYHHSYTAIFWIALAIFNLIQYINLKTNKMKKDTDYPQFNTQEKDLAYWKANAEEDYMKVPISVLRYISELEKELEIFKNK